MTTQKNSECIFCAIANGAAPAHIVLAAPTHIAFLDRRPLFHGHTLLMPRDHVPTLSQLPDGLVTPLFLAARALAKAVQAAMEAEGTFFAVNNTVSQSVPHLHIHIVPRSRGDGLRGFFWPRKTYRGEEHAAQVAQAIREALGSAAA
jgi:histidine triad (HIT) family protein